MPEDMPDGRPEDMPETSDRDLGPAGRTPPDDADAGRDRLLASLIRPSRAQAVVAVLLAVLGFAAVTQVRSNQTSNTYASLREEDLIQVLTGLNGAAERARNEIQRLEETQRQLESETSSRNTAIQEAQTRVEDLNILAGLVPVHGPGIRMVVTEVDGRVKLSSLLDTVQELRTAGAEAMEFNDSVRVTAQSAFDESVGGIVLDGQELSSPYVIEVIGEPRTLDTGLNFTSGPIEKLEDYDGASVEITELDDVEISSVVEATRPESATPAPGE